MTTSQTSQFIPLVAAAPSAEGREFQITVIPQKEHSQPFQSLEAALPGGGQRPAKRSCEPQLSLQRDGGRVTSIRIQCTCGQTIDLACIYDEPPRPAEKANG
jgi:hypothetical protein